jgi:heme-degrading monooxygenase HmoA
MVVTIFRSRLRPKHQDQYLATAARMRELAEAMPGFISFKTFMAQDGERVSIIEFESEETHEAWRNHPEHRATQKLGRELFYAEYRIQVCTVQRQHSFSMPATA